MPATRFYGPTFKDLDNIIKTYNGKVWKKDLDETKKQMMEFYRDKRLPLKFRGRMSNPEYTPNTARYEAQKRKRWGAKPQLVASGRAKGQVLGTAKVSKQGRGYAIKMKAPFYMGNSKGGQIRLGRPWNAFNSRDIRSMKRFFMKRIRQARKLRRARKT